MFFEKIFDPILKPFREIRNRWVSAKSVQGQVKMDVTKAKNLGSNVQGYAGQAQDMAGKGQAAVAGAQQGAQGYMQQAAGAAGGAPPINPNPPIRTTGFWIFKKKFCSQCEKQLDKTWDACPHCAQAAQAQAAANAPKAPMKTQAIAIGNAGGGGGAANPFSGMQMIGWIVPLQGPQRGELFTLGSQTIVGKDPSCTLVLQDSFLSSRHAEIKIEAGSWILKDMGSTNGTYVNDKRVDKQELVDNDFVKFGQFLCKFKSL